MAVITKHNQRAVTPPPGNDAETRRTRVLALFDIAVLLGALLIFFAFISVLMRIVFPQGARLTEITVMESGVTAQDDERGAIDIAGGSGGMGFFDAYLGDIRRDVKIRPANSVAWTSARKGTEVRNRDAVQTYSNSRARVDFTSDNHLKIGQNSLVVFSDGVRDPFLGRRDAAVVVMDGELTGEVRADYGALGIEFPAGLVELTADEESGEAVDFRVSVNADKTSTIAVYSGIADINIAGEHYLLGAGKGITITEDGMTAGVSDLPNLPLIHQPNDNRTARYLQLPPRVSFSWGNVRGAKRYRFEIAEDAEFEDLIVDETLESNTFTHGNLASGQYFWRVSAMTGWTQGPATLARRLNIVRDLEPPELDLMPIERLTANAYVVRGSTTRNAKVYVLGERVRTNPDGRFEHQFDPEPGTQAIVVESIDDVGNAAYSSQLLHVPGNAGRSELP